MACRKPSTTSSWLAPSAGGNGSTRTPEFTPVAWGEWFSTGPLVGTVAHPARATSPARQAATSRLLAARMRELLQVGRHHRPR